MSMNIVERAIQEVRGLVEAGWEYPDASIKVAIKYGIDTDWIHLQYDQGDDHENVNNG